MQPDKESAAAPIPSIESQSMDAFYRDLPELLKKHSREWVAYHGDELIGVGRTKTALYLKCLGDGLKEDEFVVRFVHELALSDHEEVYVPEV